jgi:hypothetical protein
MSISKIILIFLLLYIVIYQLTINKSIIKDKSKNKKSKNNIEKNIEKYIEKNILDVGKTPSVLFFSDKKSKDELEDSYIKSLKLDNSDLNYIEKIKDTFKLTNEDYKELINLPEGSKVKINLKKDWRYVLNNEIDSIDNNIDIKFTKLGKDRIDSQLIYELSSNVNEIFEFKMDKFDAALKSLINSEKEEYVLNNTDFNNLFEDNEFDYYKEYEKYMKKYDTTGHLISFTDNLLNKETELLNQFDEIHTYETHCGLEKRLGSIVFKNNENNENNNNKKYGDDIDEYHKKYNRVKLEEPEILPFKLVEYNDVKEGLVNNFKEIEEMILSKINRDLSLIIVSDTIKKIKNLNINNNFEIVDRKINYILKNTEKTDEYFYNGEIVLHRERNHGIHIKIEGLKQRYKYYITNYDILGIVINDKINKIETITDNIINPLYYKYHDRHVITKSELEKELGEIIDRGSVENFIYLFSKFKKLRSDRGIMINDFELLMYTGKILYDIKHTDNLKKINKINNPSIYTKIFGT